MHVQDISFHLSCSPQALFHNWNRRGQWEKIIWDAMKITRDSVKFLVFSGYSLILLINACTDFMERVFLVHWLFHGWTLQNVCKSSASIWLKLDFLWFHWWCQYHHLSTLLSLSQYNVITSSVISKCHCPWSQTHTISGQSFYAVCECLFCRLCVCLHSFWLYTGLDGL